MTKIIKFRRDNMIPYFHDDKFYMGIPDGIVFELVKKGKNKYVLISPNGTELSVGPLKKKKHRYRFEKILKG